LTKFDKQIDSLANNNNYAGLSIPIRRTISADKDHHSERQKTTIIRLLWRFCGISVDLSWIANICEKAVQIIQKSPDQTSELCLVCDRLMKFIPTRPLVETYSQFIKAFRANFHNLCALKDLIPQFNVTLHFR
jgi:hypothetical protein